ncbi:hypothetical protein V6N12_058639 [Hibiscus sabdariffa]|uniref:Zinc knuckle CX2CX4HX4C domain-containing protein n=1 Tax=Hibiscus sabdariffa TaxID=183260 RepID=A0ABR2EST5_9ROSI
MDTENPIPTSIPVIVQSGRPPDLAIVVMAINGPMVSAHVVIPHPGSIDDNMDTNGVNVVKNDLRVSPCPSFRDMVARRFTTEQRDNFISDMDVEFLYEDAIEYEGLPVICFGCGKYGHTKDAYGVGNLNATNGVEHRQHQPSVDDRFGPCMQVVNRRRRPFMVRKVAIPDTQTAKGGSQFEVLNVEDGDNHQAQAPATQRETNTESRSAETPSKIPGSIASSSHSALQHVHEVVGKQQLNGGVSGDIATDTPDVAALNSMVRDTSVDVAAKDKVVNAPSSLKPDKHKAVRVIEENQARGGRAKKKIELDGEQTVVTDWALSLSRTLYKEGELVSKSNVVSGEKSVESSNGVVQWIENSTFEGGSQPPQQ